MPLLVSLYQRCPSVLLSVLRCKSPSRKRCGSLLNAFACSNAFRPESNYPCSIVRTKSLTMSRIAILLLAAVAAVTGEELVAVVNLTPHDVGTRNVTGELTITQSVHNGPVVIRGTVYGLTEGRHGFHVHEKGDMSNRCLSTGAHFNPENVTHGAPEDTVRHVGDLGNIEANMNGVAIVDITDNVISLTGPNNILGRAIVVHSAEDDLGKGNSTLSTTTGNAGDRWACGIVAALSPTGRWENSGSFNGPNVSMLVTALAMLVYQHIKN